MLKYFITIDPYTDIEQYNEGLNALKNNQIEYNEFISTKPPYNWYLNLDQLPILVNYDIAPKNVERFLVSKIQPLRPNEEYLLKRRETDGSNEASLEKFINNKVFDTKDKYALVFRYKSKEELIQLTKDIKAKVYILGTYKRRKIALTFNKYIAGELLPSYIMLEKKENELNKLGEFELELSYKGFKGKDKILKYTQTPYWKDGKYHPTKVNL